MVAHSRRASPARRQITTFKVDDLPAQIAANVPRGDGSERHVQRRPMGGREGTAPGRRLHHLRAGARRSKPSTDSGLVLDTEEKKYRAGVLIGSGIGGLPGIEEASITLHEKGPRKISPFFIPGRLINLVSGQASIRFGLKGPNHAVVTACSTGAHAIGDAARMIMLDDADVMLAGGAEAAISRLGMAGFAACRALSTGFQRRAATRFASLRQGSRRLRDGRGRGRRRSRRTRTCQTPRREDLCRSERLRPVGRRLSHHLARRRRRRRLPRDANGAEARGHDAVGHRLCERARHLDARWATRSNCRAVERLFGNASEQVSMSSTKSSIGHLLGAAGAVEAIFCILAMRDQICPPTLNLDNPSVETKIDLVPHKAEKARNSRGLVELVRIWRDKRHS